MTAAAAPSTAAGIGEGLATLGTTFSNAMATIASRANVATGLLLYSPELNANEDAELAKMREEQASLARARAAAGLPPYNDLWHNPAAILGSIQNIAVNAYADRAKHRKDDPDCRLRPYSEGCANGETPHHVVPDRAWREPSKGGRYYFPCGPSAPATSKGGTRCMNHGKGLCICVTGKGRVQQHGVAHAMHDKVEFEIGKTSTPKYIAPLFELEALGAGAVSLATGCDFKDLLKQLRDYHDKHGFDPLTKLRADPRGDSGLTVEKFKEATGATRSGGLF